MKIFYSNSECKANLEMVHNDIAGPDTETNLLSNCIIKYLRRETKSRG